jgi:hypothetical protein
VERPPRVNAYSLVEAFRRRGWIRGDGNIHAGGLVTMNTHRGLSERLRRPPASRLLLGRAPPRHRLHWFVAPDGIECFIAPATDADAGLLAGEAAFGPGLVGKRTLNPENPRGYIMIVTRENRECPNP